MSWWTMLDTAYLGLSKIWGEFTNWINHRKPLHNFVFKSLALMTWSCKCRPTFLAQRRSYRVSFLTCGSANLGRSSTSPVLQDFIPPQAVQCTLLRSSLSRVCHFDVGFVREKNFLKQNSFRTFWGTPNRAFAVQHLRPYRRTWVLQNKLPRGSKHRAVFWSIQGHSCRSVNWDVRASGREATRWSP